MSSDPLMDELTYIRKRAMTDIADQIKDAVNRRPPVPGKPTSPDYAQIRADAYSALIRAHIQLAGDAPLNINDMRILDILDQWLSQKRPT
jgi:hypothetical protein